MAFAPQKVQIKRTRTSDKPPTGLQPGELSVEMGVPLRLWVGVPTDLDASGKKLLVPQSGVVVGDTPPTVPGFNQLWWETDTGILWLYYYDGGSTQWVQVSSSGGKVEEVATDADEIKFQPGGTLSADDVQEALMELDGEKLAKAGGTMTGVLTLIAAAPTAATDAAHKGYVDSQITPLTTAINGKVSDAPSDGQVYGRSNAAWVVVTAGGGGTAASTITFTPAGAISSINVQNAIAELDNEKVSKLAAGDTMLGNLVINKILPALWLDRTDINPAVILGRKSGSSRWALQLGDGNTESGGNAGSNFVVNRHNDAGTLMDAPLTIARATGLATVLADPTAPLGVSTKQYVDGKVAAVTTNIPITFPFSGKPGVSTRVNVPMAIAATIPANLAGSLAYASIASTADAVFTVNKISGGATVAVGTITMKVTGLHTFSGAGAVFVVGDVLQVIAPATQDATLADVGITIVTQRS